MIPPSRQAKGDRKVKLSNFNSLVDGIRRGELTRVGPGLVKTTMCGITTFDLPRRIRKTYEPFEPVLVSRVTRQVKVNEGVCYVYGVAFPVAETNLTMEVTPSTTEYIWVQFPITPGSEDEATVEFGTTSELFNIDRNLFGFRVLAHVHIASGDNREPIERRWFGGDVYFDD
jgi:hypothetical protein